MRYWVSQDLNLTRRVERFCKKKGIDIVGFADPKLFDRFEKLNTPDFYLKDSVSVIVIGMYLYDIVLDAWSIRANSNFTYQFIDNILENYCHKVKDFLLEKGYKTEVITYSPGFYLKDSAALAGIGPIGKNNLLITEKYGSQVRLRALTTTAPLKHGTPIKESKYCENCTKCIDACPAQALIDGKYLKDACYDYQKANLRKLSDETAIWCNTCIEVCPVGDKY